MNTFGSVDEALDFAISREIEANEFYVELAGRVASPAMKRLFEQFAGEEEGHRIKLEGVKRDRSLLPAHNRITDLKISDYLVSADPSPDIGYQDALILAMNKEKAAFRMYVDLAEAATDSGLQALFRSLAQEEANHKLRFEIEYDNEVMTEN
jgi:rubrerythrin